jgi:hypothetical protein
LLHGDAGLDLLEAFEKIKKWHDFEMSPDHIWHALMDNFYRGDEIEIRAEWYTPEARWDVEGIMVRRSMLFLLQQGRVLIKRSHILFIPLTLYNRMNGMTVIRTRIRTRRRSSFGSGRRETRNVLI